MKVRETVARNLRIARNDRMLEREEYNPTIEMLEKLAAALDLKVVDFFKTDANQ
ncbi:transcriptional regulator [Sinorhizobium medicae]|nr:XRE family transcriptional regulator [Sinorhizobium medicae]PLU62282.1 transcriptional regulator [Sinorhizobium medicae]